MEKPSRDGRHSCARVRRPGYCAYRRRARHPSGDRLVVARLVRGGGGGDRHRLLARLAVVALGCAPATVRGDRQGIRVRHLAARARLPHPELHRARRAAARDLLRVPALRLLAACKPGEKIARPAALTRRKAAPGADFAARYRTLTTQGPCPSSRPTCTSDRRNASDRGVSLT